MGGNFLLKKLLGIVFADRAIDSKYARSFARKNRNQFPHHKIASPAQDCRLLSCASVLECLSA